jgi:thiol:disulfide interchange protein
MDTFKKVMAVPMGLTALALLWLTWRLGGPWFAFMALFAAIAIVDILRLLAWPRGDGRARRLVGPVTFLFLAAITMPQFYSPPSSKAEQESFVAATPFSEAALAEARASGQPVFVWFTADWCLTCKVNESVAIEREATKAAFERAGVKALVGDWTRRDPAITRFLTTHGAAGVPLYLWYPAGGEARQLPQVLTPDSLVELARAD